MVVNKYSHIYFKDVYYSNKEVNWNNPLSISFMAGDTETHLYYNGKLLSEEEAEYLMENNGQTWCRCNINVVAWSFMLSNDEYFFCFTNIEDFMLACSMLRVKTVVWYNAKFDFAIFDYYFLKNEWNYSNDIINERGIYGKLPANTFNSLHGQQGQRYKLTFWYEYINKNKDYKVHKTEMIDLFNVLGGGLAKNLEDWNVTDKDGNAIRKLEMDYVNDNIDDCVDYLVNDTLGLYYLTMKFSQEFESITGLSYINGEYMTCGGVAKKVMLQEMYQCSYKDALKKFHEDFYMSADLDELFRSQNLYKGGKTFVNKKYEGKAVSNVYKLDENSMYPHKMKTMRLPYGKPLYMEEYIDNDDIKIFHITSMYGTLKPKMVGVWQDLSTNEFTDIIDETEPFFIFEEELNELENWYNITMSYDFIYYYKARHNKGMEDFISKFYKIKCESKGTVKLVSKIVLNSSYGKLSEKCVRETGKYELSEDGYVHYVKLGEKVDTRSILSVVVGSYVTALSRTDLMKKIRKVCNENPEDNFIYCDTDSIHAFTCNIECDDKELGMLKNEAPDKRTYDYCIYLAPKSYLMLHKDYDKVHNSDTLVIHCKGVNVKEVRKLIEGKTFREMLEVFKPNYPIRCLTGINAIGGKALIYKTKYILKQDDFICDMTYCEGGVFYEQ